MVRRAVGQGERLDELCLAEYGRTDDAALLTVVRANQDSWTGELADGGTVEIPSVVDEDAVLRSPALPARTDGEPFVGGRTLGERTGEYLSPVDAVRQSVLSRVRTRLGSRPYGGDYGGVAVPLALGADFGRGTAALTAAIESALAPDADWHRFVRADYGQRGDALTVLIRVEIIADGTPVDIALGVSQ